MATICPNCESYDVLHQDSHKEWEDAINYKEIHYYECKECGNEFATKR